MKGERCARLPAPYLRGVPEPARLADGRRSIMQTKVDQISDRIYRLSTWIPDIGPGGFTFNQFLVDAPH